MGHSLSCVNDRSNCSHLKNSKCLKCVYTRSKECLNRTVPSGETLLTIASLNGDLVLATQLIALGANINQQNISGNTPLHVAIRNKHTRLVNFLLECGADVNARDRSGLTPLHFACFYGNYDIVKRLLDAGSYPNGISDNKFYVSTPLMIATENRNRDIAELLLERGADVDKKDWWMNTAFLKAVHVGNVELVKLLLKYGANPNVENRFGGMALLYATIADHCEITRLLVKSGCSLRLKNSCNSNNNNNGNNNNNSNNNNNNNNSCNIHFKNGNKKQIERYPPLAAVIHRACYDCFKFFLDQGVDVNESLQCKSCKTPLLYAVTNRAWDCHDQHLRPMPQCYHSETPVSIDSTRLQFARELIERGSLLRPVWEGVVWQMRSFYVMPSDCEALSLLISAMGFIHKENFKVETFYRTLVLSCQWNAMWLLYCAGFSITEECRLIASKFRMNMINTSNRYNSSSSSSSSSAVGLASYLTNEFQLHLYGRPTSMLINGVNEVDCLKAIQWLDYWLDNILPNPRSLKNICIIKLREHLNENVFFHAKKLNLPKPLYDLVTLTSFSMLS